MNYNRFVVAANLLWLVAQMAFAQSVQLSFPIDRSVLQRNGSNQAAVTIAGQITGGNTNANTYQLYYRTATLNASGNATSTTGWTSLSFGSTGMFHTTPTFSRGWYRLDMGVFNQFTASIAVAASVKFGVGDVFVVAGQSNAQGVDNPNWGLPNTSTLPEWIVGVNLDWSCKVADDATRPPMYLLPPTPVFSRIDGYNRVSPSGNSSWCYAVLGKAISDANSGMPVAFFNAASGGSSIKNWSESSTFTASRQPYTLLQTCFNPATANGRTADYFRGFPYITLEQTLVYYTSLFGVRALLWHQGETEADPNRDANDRTTDTQTYKQRLQQVIDRTRQNRPGLSWMIARATYFNGGNITPSVRTAQLEKGQEPDKNVGPDTDFLSNGTTNTGPYRSDQTHFDENSIFNNVGGLTYLGLSEWADRITVNQPGPAGFSPISANPVPTINVSRSGSNRILSVTPLAGALEYRWGIDINNFYTQYGTNNTSITVSTTQDARCFIRDANGNWRVTARVTTSCPSCRENAEGTSDDPFGLALTVYPNPVDRAFTVEFDVPEPASSVRLEIIDADGEIMRTVVDTQHDKGHWTYPVQGLELSPNRLFSRNDDVSGHRPPGVGGRWLDNQTSCSGFASPVPCLSLCVGGSDRPEHGLGCLAPQCSGLCGNTAGAGLVG